VIPSTTLGLVVFLAALGPGYLYLRVAEQRTARASRSGLVEAVELVVVGALASTIALLVVVTVADWLHLVDAESLSLDPGRYFHRHGLPVLRMLAVTLAVAYGLAYGGARLNHLRRRPTIKPGATAWQTAFDFNRPTQDHIVVANVELRDRRLFSGILGGFTVDSDDNREVCLWGPIAVRVGPRNQAQLMDGDDFIVFREADIVTISGRYLEGMKKR
jgi:hypothetical protein